MLAAGSLVIPIVRYHCDDGEEDDEKDDADFQHFHSW